MSDTRRAHPARMKNKRRVLRQLAGEKPAKQRRSNERAALRKEYR